MKKKVEGHAGFLKDEDTGVITNNSQSAREKYRIEKQRALKTEQNDVELQEVKQELSELKGLLKQLLNSQ